MKQCPKCNIAWESEAEIPDDLIRAGHYTTRVKAELGARNYGWTTKNGERFSINLIKVFDRDTNKQTGVWCMKCGVCQPI